MSFIISNHRGGKGVKNIGRQDNLDVNGSTKWTRAACKQQVRLKQHFHASKNSLAISNATGGMTEENGREQFLQKDTDKEGNFPEELT